MFNVLFSYLIAILTPTRLRQLKVLAWLRLITSYIKCIYDEYDIYRTLKLYLINFTGQIMYLEKLLQDEFKCAGIYISDSYLVLPFYLFNVNESYLPVYAGNLFVPGTIYQEGNVIVYDNYYYEYTAPGNGNNPDEDPAAVKGEEIETYFVNISETTSANDFIVNIPTACYNSMTADDINKMHSIINFYKLVNKTYTLKTY